MATKKFIVSIDGPAASGKGTVAEAIAAELNFFLLPTGLFYRGLAYALLCHNYQVISQEGPNNPALDFKTTLWQSWQSNSPATQPEANANGQHDEWPKPLWNQQRLDSLLANLPLYLADENLLQALASSISAEWLDFFARFCNVHHPIIAGIASKIAANVNVRRILTHKLREFAFNQDKAGIVAEGRDTATVIFPEADCKIFLTARLKVRAQRRFAQLQQNAETAVAFQNIIDDMAHRDWQDSTRTVAPTRMDAHALLLDSSGLSKESTVNLILRHVENLLNK